MVGEVFFEIQSNAVKTFTSETRISKALTWPQNFMVQFIFVFVVLITLESLLDMCLNFISCNAAL